MSKHLRLAFASLYGPWIVSTYLVFKKLAPNALVETFAIAALFGSIGLLIISRGQVFKTMREPLAWVRGFFFGITQVFIFRALIEGDTTSVFVTYSTALIISLLLSNYILKEAATYQEIIGTVGAILGLCLIMPAKSVTINGALAGIFHAASIFTARKVGLKGSSLLGNVTLGLFLGGLLSLALVPQGILTVIYNPQIWLPCAVLTTLTQIYFIWLTFNFTSNTVNQISQTRIVWSLILNSLLFFQIPKLGVTLGAILTFMSAALAITKPKSGSLINITGSMD